MAWLLIIVAGLLETVWAVAMKESHGFSRLLPTAVFVVAATTGFWLLSLALRDLTLGSGYAVWVGIGAVGAAVCGILIFGEPVTAARLTAIALILIGVVWLALAEGGSDSAS